MNMVQPWVSHSKQAPASTDWLTPLNGVGGTGKLGPDSPSRGSCSRMGSSYQLWMIHMGGLTGCGLISLSIITPLPWRSTR